MSDIIWLVSYLKSGNTWLRAFLNNYLQDGDVFVSINALTHTRGVASAAALIERELGVEASNLTLSEIEIFRPAVYREMARRDDGQTLFLKVHDAYGYVANGEPMFPPEATKRVLYILRNPLDVAVSLAFHDGCSFDRAIQKMGDPDFAYCANTEQLSNQTRQYISSWSRHIQSWVDMTEDVPLCIVRYEDMSQKPGQTFAQIVKFIDLPWDEARLHKAIAFSDFKILQQQEQTEGFQERPVGMKAFFRQGQVGGWREHLSEAQAQRIMADHRPVMERFGYLTAEGRPVY